MQAVIYCRVSTEEQTHNLSLPLQERVCREYCSDEGFNVARVFVERGESAKTINRPEFRSLITFCRENKGRIHALVVHSLNRFSRNTADHHTIRALLAGFGIRLHSVTERFDDSPMGRFMEAMLAGLAQFDNDVRAERTVAGMKEAVSRGRWVWRAPLGYENGRSKLSPSLLPDPAVAPLIRQAFELYANQGVDRRALLQRLTALGLRSRQGKPLSPQSLHNLLRNPVYAGRIRSSIGGDEQAGDFEPLVSDVLFLGAQARLSGRTPNAESRHRDNPEFPLRRFVRCGVCQTPLTGSSPRGRGKHYGYYSCRKGCSGVSTAKDVLEGQFLGLLESLQPRAEYLTLFKAVVLDCWKIEMRSARDVVARLDARIRNLEQQIRDYHQALVVQKTIDAEGHREMVGRVREDLAVARIERNEAQIEETDVEGLLAFAEHVISNAAALWVSASAGDRLALQRAFFPDGLSWDGRRFGTAVTCLAFCKIQESTGETNGMASPPGFEPGFQP